MNAPKFSDIQAPRPTAEGLTEEYRRLHELLDVASDADSLRRAVGDWDDQRRRTDTWSSLVNLHFEQDTRNADYKAERDYCDQLRPKITELQTVIKKRLLAAPLRGLVEECFGAQAPALWEVQVLTFDPAIADDLPVESKLEAEYTELLASAEFEFHGEKLNLSTIGKYGESPARDTRYDSIRMKWDWVLERADRLDELYDKLVRLRHGMARKLGMDDFIEMGYRRMCRIDYDRDDVEQFRREVVREVVPLSSKLRRRQADALGLEKLMYWDEPIHDPRGNPKPAGDHDWMLDRATEMFDAMSRPLGDFFHLMRDGGFLDLKSRDGKAGGGFCTSFPTIGMPFIFANFNGTKGDVEVFTHEMGHAFQGYMSRHQPLFDYLWPTLESCEIHSMSLEFLTWPQMHLFFGPNEAERFRRLHLTHSLQFLPYGVAVDHFQHLVYAEPDASPERRRQMWREMERLYLPDRDYGDLPYPSRGGIWQLQRHIYHAPFYYIDYTLAQTCALQFWLRSERDRDAALDDYTALCRRGGEAPFGGLVASAGLQSPFESGVLSDVVRQARRVLEI